MSLTRTIYIPKFRMLFLPTSRDLYHSGHYYTVTLDKRPERMSQYYASGTRESDGFIEL